VFPTIYIPGNDVLLGTTTYDLNAVSDSASSAAGAKSAGYHFTGAGFGGLRAEDRVVVTVNLSGTYIAWSPWGIPAYSGGNTGSSWGIARVNGVDDSIDVVSVTGAPYDGYAAARAAWMAQHPDGIEFTGSDEYWFFIHDSPTGDNSGGVSITVQVFGRSR